MLRATRRRGRPGFASRPRVGAHALGERRHRGGLEQHRERILDAPELLRLAEEPHRDERVTAEREEVVVDPDAIDTEELAEAGRELLLDFVARRFVATLELRALELDRGLLAQRRARSLGALAPALEVDGAHQDGAAPIAREQALERRGTLAHGEARLEGFQEQALAG
jgi:hypothetical protein